MARPQAIHPISKESNFINWANYSEPGVGKSVLAGTSPNALFLVNDSDETTSMVAHGATGDVWECQNYTALTDAYEFLRHGGTEQYEWVWIDNGTLFQEQGMDQIMDDLVAKRPHRNRYVPDRAEYGENQSRMSLLLRNFKALPIHLGITFHVMRITDPDDHVVLLPLLQGGQDGKFSQKICGYMNLVTYMTVVSRSGKEERKLITRKRGKIYAKDRFHTFGREYTIGTNEKDIIANGVPEMMEMIRKRVPTLGRKDVPAPARRTRRPTRTTTKRGS